MIGTTQYLLTGTLFGQAIREVVLATTGAAAITRFCEGFGAPRLGAKRGKRLAWYNNNCRLNATQIDSNMSPGRARAKR